jgi:hypothetical protein
VAPVKITHCHGTLNHNYSSPKYIFGQMRPGS